MIPDLIFGTLWYVPKMKSKVNRKLDVGSNVCEDVVARREVNEELMQSMSPLSRFIPIGREDIEWLKKQELSN